MLQRRVVYNIENAIGDIVKEIYGDVEVDKIEINHIYDGDDKICEFAIDIFSDNVSYGYLIYNVNLGEISKFAIDKSAKGFLETYIGKKITENQIIKKIDFMKYEVVDLSDTTITYMGSRTELKDVFIDDLIEVHGQKKLIKEKYIPNTSYFGQDYIEEILKDKYCCAAVAILNVLAQYDRFDINNEAVVGNTYSWIWSLGGVKKLNDIYVMNQEIMGWIVRDMSRWYGGKEIQYREKENPKLSFFKEAVDKKYVSILGVTTKNKGTLTGHAVSVTDYLEFDNGKCYLAIASGWGTVEDIQYILYEEIKVIFTYGVMFLSKCK